MILLAAYIGVGIFLLIVVALTFFANRGEPQHRMPPPRRGRDEWADIDWDWPERSERRLPL